MKSTGCLSVQLYDERRDDIAAAGRRVVANLGDVVKPRSDFERAFDAENMVEESSVWAVEGAFVDFSFADSKE
jgi:hypothetical protein